ncbi:MAG: hypothetical protein IKA58_05730 [Clostridia bacterium]|nr:hypothetical protein [Clostridia bacterium]
MNEWTIFLTLSVLATFIFTVGRPVINLNKTITENTAAVKSLRESMATFRSESHETHQQQWEQIHKNSEKLVDHEARIHTLEQNQ